ncbi:MAG: hypothetical protein IT432_16015 [Phycisphaerales bacterium]|nr:hypothetical protein [Phycisphaerales bacterium]
MKLKGINTFEQYVDKALFGLVGASLLGVLAWQFVGPGNQIEVAGQMVDPDKAYGPVKTQAEAILAKVNSQSPELPVPPRADVLKRFEDRLTKGVSPGKNIVALAPRLPLTPDAGASLAGNAEAPIAPLAVPAPSGVMAATFASAIDPMEVIANDELAKLLPKEQPFDKQAVSVEAVFDGTALTKALENDPEGDPRSIPLGWWRGQMGVVAVEMERERQLSSGEWGETTIVPPMPGRVSLLKDLDKSVKSKGDLPLLVSQASQAQDLIMRPAYYNIIAGPEWTPPTEMAAGETKSEKIDRIQKQINDMVKEEAVLKRRLENKGKQATAPDRGRDTSEGDGGGGHGGGRGRPGQIVEPKPASRPNQSDRPDKPVKRDPIEVKLEEVSARIVKAQAELDKLNAPEQTTSGESQKRLPLLDDPKVRVWTHDISAEPGATYRYRVRVVTNNPLYGQKLVEAQKADSESPVARGLWSEWTDPITVEAKEYFFITGASPSDELGTARASAEMYKFYYGFWRKGAAAVEPGDVLAAQAKLPDELRLWDMDKLKAGAKPRITQSTGNERDGGDGKRGGGGRRSAGGDAEEQPATKDDADKSKLEDDGLSKPAPKIIDFIVDAMMLDTSALPSSSERSAKSKFRTFFRDHSGQIVVRYPDVDAASDLYKRLASNAKLGENQGRPKVKAVNPQDLPQPTRPGQDDRPGHQPPPPDSGDGGGGSGGG